MIYFDNSATTFVDPKVLETFNKVCTEYPGNSNSIHSLGVKSKELEEYATEKIARLLNVKPSEIIYTSGASESNNTVLKGVASRYKNRGNHIITTHLEHSSTIETVKYLESKGFIIDYVKINKDGLIDLDNLKELINDKTILVAISYVDSELGIKQNIKEIKKIINNYPKCYFHVDATQAIGKIKVDFNDMDFMSMSGHKIFGMKGIGLLIKKDNIVIDNLIHGGKSTTVYRSGTPALPLICSLMKALELIIPKVEDNYKYVEELNNKINSSFEKIFDSYDDLLIWKEKLGILGRLEENTIFTQHYYSARRLFASTWNNRDSADTIFDNLKAKCEELKEKPNELSTFISEYVSDFENFAVAYIQLIKDIEVKAIYQKPFCYLEFTATLYPLLVRL